MTLQEDQHVLPRTAPQPDVYHGANQHSHHALKKAVCLDVKTHPPIFRAGRPLGKPETAAVVRLVGLGGERTEVVVTPNYPGGGVQQIDIDRLAKRPLEGPPKRGSGCFIQSDVIAVPS